MIFSQGDYIAENQSRCILFVNGNLTAKTVKYCTIIASGNVHVDSLIDSSVIAGGEVTGSVPQYEVYINNNKGAVAASSNKLVQDPKIAKGYFYSLSKPEVLRHISNYYQAPESSRYSLRDAYFFEKEHLVVNNVTGRWDICTGLQMNGGAGWQECHDVRDFKRFSARKISFRDESFIKMGGKDLKFEVYDQNAKLVSSIDIAKYSKLFSSSINVESREYKSYLDGAYPSAKASIASEQSNFLFESLYNQLGKKCNSEISLNQRIYSYSTTCADGYKYKEEFNIADRINLLDRAKIVFHELANMGALSSCDNLPDHVFNVIEVNDKAKLFNAEFDTVMPSVSDRVRQI